MLDTRGTLDLPACAPPSDARALLIALEAGFVVVKEVEDCADEEEVTVVRTVGAGFGAGTFRAAK